MSRICEHFFMHNGVRKGLSSIACDEGLNYTALFKYLIIKKLTLDEAIKTAHERKRPPRVSYVIGAKNLSANKIANLLNINSRSLNYRLVTCGYPLDRAIRAVDPSKSLSDLERIVMSLP